MTVRHVVRGGGEDVPTVCLEWWVEDASQGWIKFLCRRKGIDERVCVLEMEIDGTVYRAERLPAFLGLRLDRAGRVELRHPEGTEQ